MIASPGDVKEERIAAFEIILRWNEVNGLSKGIVLLPIGWETSSAPLIHATKEGIIPEPQEVINAQVLAKADLLVALFWNRLGTPTRKEQSGTVEEIKKHIEAGKPVMLYFSDAAINPSRIDSKQKQKVDRFKSECQKQKYFYGNFDSESDFRNKFTQQLGIILSDPFFSKSATTEKESLVNNVSANTSIDKPAFAPISIQTANSLLLEASEDSDGTIHVYRITAGYFVESNHKNFVKDGTPREEAILRDALTYLVTNKFIVLDRANTTGQYYQMTNTGYQQADEIKKSLKTLNGIIGKGR